MRQESFVQLTAFLPSLIHCSAVPRPLQNFTKFFEFLGVQLWDLQLAASEPRVLEVPSIAVAFFADGTMLFVGGDGGPISTWDIKTLQKRAILGDVDGQTPADIAISPDGQTVASAHWRGKVRLFRAATREEVRAAGWE